jgi:quercetin dioxygenase-like cupin family protein
MENNEEHIESDVPSILVKDGVVNNTLDNPNQPVVSVDEIIASQGNSVSWSYRLVNSDSNSATLILQLPGEGNRRHYHPNWNEWWYIIEGEWIWEIEGREFTIRKGDVVFIEKGKVHKITAAGYKPAIRLAVSREDVPHIYV